MILREKSAENTGFTFIYTSSHKDDIRGGSTFVYLCVVGREADHKVELIYTREMLEMKKIVVAIIGVLVIGVGAIVLFAQKSEGGRRGGFGQQGIGMIFKKLELTEAQQTQAKEIVQAGFDKNKGVFEALKANREKMKAATANGSFDEAAVTAIAAEQAGLMSQLIVEKERTKSQLYAILTDEQKAKAVELEQQFESKMKSRFGKRGGFGGPEISEE